ncbi:MFS transporter [Paenibacillus sp. FSL H7-0331]|uniref:MFS transporter n=1 Tax=Paenibacillus sp. FSL H7-0331 TaxID=1920421 RepID=UPI00096F77AA|nr:MFS transporter [Paenibacillus sp. FSL H7-0331]OMF20018.1 MFS transporter [Paenibacillus sp. FSL H7-0331]
MSTLNSTTPSRAQHIIFIVVTVSFWASLYTYVPILSPYLEHLGASYSFAGLVLGSYGLVQIVLRLPLGIASDRLKARKPFMMLGMLATSLSCLCFAWGEHMGWALAGRIMSGIGASTWAAFTVLYASYFRQEHMTRAMGLISLLTAAGQLLGMSISGYLVEEWGWSATFWAGSFIGIVGLLVSVAIREPKQSIALQPIRLSGLLQVMKEPLLLKVSMLSILAHSVLFITMFGFTPSLAIALGANKFDLTLLVFAFMIPHAMTSFLSGRVLAPRFGSWQVVAVAFVCSALCTVVMPLVNNFSMLLITQIFNGFFQGLHFPLLLGLVIQHIQPGKRATAMGFYQAVYATGMFAGPFMAGWLNEFGGLNSGFYFAGILGFVAAALTWIWKKSQAEHELG